MRRLTALLLTGILVTGTVAGCGAGNGAPDSGAGVQEEENAAGGQAAENAADDSTAGLQAETDTGEPLIAVPGAETAAEEEIPVEGTVFNIYCIGEDFKSRVQDYYPEYEAVSEDTGAIGQIQVRWHVYSDAEEYRDTLEKMLDSRPETSDEGSTSQTVREIPADDRVDLFIVDEADLRDYVESEVSLDVTGQIGITREELADQFPYTQQMATDGEGRLKAVTWQATPGVFVYRRSIANKVLGTDDPDKVQEAVSDWEKFAGTAQLNLNRTAIRTGPNSGAMSGGQTTPETGKYSASSIQTGGSVIRLRARRKGIPEAKRTGVTAKRTGVTPMRTGTRT